MLNKLQVSIAQDLKPHLCLSLRFPHQPLLKSLSDWWFKEATLIRSLVNGTVVQAGDEGLLYVTLFNNQTQKEKKGTVCHDGFNVDTARMFCKHVGYQVEEVLWGSDQNKYVPEYDFT